MGGSGSYRGDLITDEAPIKATWVLVVVSRSACALTDSMWAGGNRNGRDRLTLTSRPPNARRLRVHRLPPESEVVPSRA